MKHKDIFFYDKDPTLLTQTDKSWLTPAKAASKNGQVETQLWIQKKIKAKSA